MSSIEGGALIVLGGILGAAAIAGLVIGYTGAVVIERLQDRRARGR